MSVEKANSATGAMSEIPGPYKQFLLFGDSITEMSYNSRNGFAFGAELSSASPTYCDFLSLREDPKVYSRRRDVLNRGFSGYNTMQAIKVLPQFMPNPFQANVRLMAIWFGANDACLEGTDQHVPLGKYSELLAQISQHPTVTVHETKIMLITPPPLDEYQQDEVELFKGFLQPRRNAATTKKYADACRDVGRRLGIPVVDIWSAFMKAAGWKGGHKLEGSKELPPNSKLNELLADGLHLDSAGYEMTYKETMRTIKEHYPEESPEQLAMVFPGWGVAPK